MKPEDLQEILLRRIKKVDDNCYDYSQEALEAISSAILALSKLFVKDNNETDN